MDTTDPDQHPIPLGIIAVDLLIPGSRAKPGTREQRAWTFDLSHSRARGEFDACAKAIAEDVGGFKKSFDTLDGAICHAISCREQSGEDAIDAASGLRAAPVLFAALNAWGCGPTECFSVSAASDAPLTRETIESWICHALLRADEDIPSAPLGKRPGL